MKLGEAYAKFFGIVEMQDPYEDLISRKGVKRIVKISFVLGFLLANLVSGLAFGWADHGFIIPTGLSVNRLVLIIVILFVIYSGFNEDAIADIDKKYDIGFIYHEDIHEDKVKHKW